MFPKKWSKWGQTLAILERKSQGGSFLWLFPKTRQLYPHDGRAHTIPPETRQMSQGATPATQNDMSRSSDTWRKTRFCGFSRFYPHVSRAHTFLLKHIECHKVPRLTRKTTWAHLLTRRERHVFVAAPIDTLTLPSRRSRTHIPPETHRMSQSAAPDTQNDMSTSSETSRKTRFCGFSNRHGNFTLTTVARGRLRTPKAGSREHVSTPRPPKCKTRTLRYAFGPKKEKSGRFHWGFTTQHIWDRDHELGIPLSTSQDFDGLSTDKKLDRDSESIQHRNPQEHQVHWWCPQTFAKLVYG